MSKDRPYRFVVCNRCGRPGGQMIFEHGRYIHKGECPRIVITSKKTGIRAAIPGIVVPPSELQARKNKW